MSVRGTELHLVEAGKGEPLLLLHGWPQDGRMWQPLIDELAQDHRVLVPDLRGFGGSDAPRCAYSKHELAADVLALLDQEGIERATIVGHDWGGWIAWLLALEHPNRVNRFASLDTPPPWRPDPLLKRVPGQVLFGSYQYVISAPLLGRRAVRSRRAVRALIKRGTGSRVQISDAAADRYARSISRPDRAHVSVALYRTFLLREIPAIARGTYTATALTVPGLVIMGGDSPVTRLLGPAEAGPNLQVETILGAGHFLVDETPDEVFALLRPFLRASS